MYYLIFSIYKIDESFAFLSGSSSNDKGDSSSHRIRETVRSAYHRVVDHKSPSSSNNDNSGSSHRVRQAVHRITDKFHHHDDKKEGSSSDSSNSRRISQTIRDAKHKISDKLHHHDDKNKGNKQNTPAFSDNGQPVPKPPSSKMSLLKKAKDVAGKAVMATLAKKIVGSSGGSKSFSKHNHIAGSGMYNNYNYRPGSYGFTQGNLCTNYLEYDGIVFGEFMCPMENFDLTATFCCGAPKEQYCCNYEDYNMQSSHDYYNSYHRGGGHGHGRRGSAGKVVGIFFLIIFLIILAIVIGIIAFIAIKIHRKKRSQDEQKNDNKANEQNEEESEEKKELNADQD